MIESTFFYILLKLLLSFGLLIYTTTTLLCIYVSLVGQITNFTNWIGKAKVYWGFGNLFFWGGFFIILTLIKLGGLLL